MNEEKDRKKLCAEVIEIACIFTAIQNLLKVRKLNPEKIDKLVAEMKELLKG